MVATSNVNATLDERGARYGSFAGHAKITQGLKAVMQVTPNWVALSPSQKEALEMVAHKIGRILNGDPDYADSWHDIGGYAVLVEQELTPASIPVREEVAVVTPAPTEPVQLPLPAPINPVVNTAPVFSPPLVAQSPVSVGASSIALPPPAPVSANEKPL